MNTENLYGLILKFPIPGMVKTRLARDIGDRNASDIYRNLAESVIRNTEPEAGTYRRIIFFSPLHMHEQFKEWIPGENLFPQKGSDIGEVMSNALAEMFERGAAKAVVTGGDILQLHRGIIVDAFSGLDRTEIVIGPARDGGYYLIGMKSPQPALFSGLSWGSTKVFRETVSLIEGLRLTWTALVTLSDVDRLEDMREAGGFSSRLSLIPHRPRRS